MEAFLITFRESLEAGVLVGILFSLLAAVGDKKHFSVVWLGVFLGVLLSVLFAFVFTHFLGGFEGKIEKIYEGILMIAASGLITHMVFWMKKNAKTLKKHVQKKVEKVVQGGAVFSLFLIAFFSVVREGVETVIFFQAIDTQSEQGISILGAVLGVLCAVILSFFLYFSSKKIPLKTFFTASGYLLLIIAAGLFAHGIVEFQGAGWLPTFIKPLFNLSSFLSEKEGIGSFLKAMFGYDANPSLIEIIGYILFLVITLLVFRRREGN